MGLEQGTSAYRVERSTTEPKNRGYEKIPWGITIYHSRKKTPSIQMKAQTGETKKIPWRETPPKMLETPPFPGIRPVHEDRPVPGRAPSHTPRSPNWMAAPVFLPVTPRAAVWGRRGAVARPREARWHSGEPVLRETY